jgi:hypothetical protein
MKTFFRLAFNDRFTHKHVGFLFCRSQLYMVGYLADFYNYVNADFTETCNPFGGAARPIHSALGTVRVDEVIVPHNWTLHTDGKDRDQCEQEFEIYVETATPRSWFLVRHLERVRTGLSLRFTKEYRYAPEQVFSYPTGSSRPDNLVPNSIFAARQAAAAAARPKLLKIVNAGLSSDP